MRVSKEKMATRENDRRRRLSPESKLVALEKKKQQRQAYEKTVRRIRLNDDSMDRWERIKATKKLKTHDEVGKLLLDFWEKKNTAQLEGHGTQENNTLAGHSTSFVPKDQQQPVSPVFDILESGKGSDSHRQKVNGQSIVDKYLERAKQLHTSFSEIQESKTESSCHVSFRAIHGLPVYMPFSMQYYSTALNSSVQSKVYILMEQTEILDVQVTPIRINVQGEMNEVMSDDLNETFYQQLNFGRLFNWINVSSIRNLRGEHSASNYLNYDCVENDRKIGNHLVESNKNVDTNDAQSEFANDSDNFAVQTAGSSEEMCYTYSHSGLYKEIKIEVPSDEEETQLLPTVIDDVIEKHTVCDVSNMTGIINDTDKSGLIMSNDQLQKKRTSSQRPLSHIRLNEHVIDGEEQQSGAFLKFDENCNPDSLPRSSRLRSKGYTIDYAKLNDFGNSFTDSNLYYSNDDIDVAIKCESIDIDDCDEMDQNDILQSDEGDEELLEEVSGSMDIDDGRQSDVQDKDSLVHVKSERETDPDYFPDHINKGKDNDDVEEFHESDSEDYNDSDDTDSCLDTPSQKKSSDEQEIHEKKVKNTVKRKKKVQNLTTKPKRILVKLEEHTEKFFFENQVSIQMKDRGKSDLEKTIKVMVCSQCNRFRTKDKAEMERHLENHINGDLSCTKCDFIGVTLREVSRHKSRSHPVNKGKYACFVCKQRFRIFEQYKEHISREHGLLPWICKTCSTIDNPLMFDDRDSYKEHAIENHKDMIHQCTSCGNFFLTTKEVKKHECEGKIKKKEMTTCDICGKVLSVGGILQHKRDVHYKIKMFPCKQCGYSATQAHRLKLHVQAKHEGVHSHKCDQCDFSCVRAFQLTSHKRTHSGHKPYKCDQCPYAAHWNVQLKSHKKLHGSPIGEECQICSIVVRKGATFKKHMKIEHGFEDM